MRARAFVGLYFLSGAAALLYEVAWMRLLALTLGHTTAAVGAVLAAFMSGLAAGAWAVSSVAATLTPRRALRVYAVLEIAIAFSALAIPYVLGASQPLLAWAYADANGGALFAALRVIVALALIAVPGAAMGASFPVGVAAVRDPGSAPREPRGALSLSTGGIRDSEDSRGSQGSEGSSAAGELYAANTIGAAIGATLTGFVLLPRLGLFDTTLVGVSLNGFAATAALLLSARHGVAAAPARSSGSQTSNAPVGVAAATLAVSGFVALVYEVTWTRVLAMTLGPTTYAFTAMLVAFIAGLAIGSAAAAARAHRTTQPGVWLGVALVVAAAACLLASAMVDQIPVTVAATAGRANADFTSVFALDIGLAIAVQLPMTIALGAAFPLAVALSSSVSDAEPRAAALIYAANTAGAIAGALAASFVLIPQLGLQRSLQLASIFVTVAGWSVAWRSAVAASRRGNRSRARLWTSSLALAVAAFAVTTPNWNHTRLVSGAYRLAPSLAARGAEIALDTGDLTYYREGAAGTVSVRELIGVRSLAIDGKVDASNGSDMLTQKLLAHLPLLLHPAPHSVYIIGLGSGVTLGAALTHPIDRAVVSEISPEVVAASNAFRAENHDALLDRRTHLLVRDGRSHLLLSAEQYDVIISEPSNPWMAGVSTLFTREFFAAARARLRPGGLLCQWAHTYNISDADLRSIVSTFLSAFPDGAAWLVGESDLLLVGSLAPIRALDEGLRDAWTRPGVAADLAEVDIRNPFSLLTLFVARGSDLRRYVEGAEVQSDDRLALEFSAPRAIYGRYQNANVEALEALTARATLPRAVADIRAAATAADWRSRAVMQLKADAPERAYRDYLEAATIAPDDPEVLAGIATAAATSNRLDDAERRLRERIAQHDSAAAEAELSRVLGARGDEKGAVVAAQRGAALDPSSDRALEQLVSALADDDDAAALEQLTILLVRTGATRPVTLYAQMRLAQLHGRFEQAAVFGERLMAGASTGENAARNYNLLGIAYNSTGNHDRARAAFEASLRIAPRAPAVLMNAGFTELRAGRPAAAEKRFSEALFLYPGLRPAIDGLAQALEQQGENRRAARVRAMASPAPAAGTT